MPENSMYEILSLCLLRSTERHVQILTQQYMNTAESIKSMDINIILVNPLLYEDSMSFAPSGKKYN